MTAAEFEAACLALPGVTKENPWGHEPVFKVSGRMFAMPNGQGGCMFKATDIAFAALVESRRARPAPYLARAQWVNFDDLSGLDADEVRDWLATAHALVAAKLTRAQRAAIGL